MVRALSVWTALVVVLVTLGSCRSDNPVSPTPGNPGPPVLAGPPVLVGAGDIGECPTGQPEATARLLDAIPGTVFTTGDTVYQMEPTAYTTCYGPTWGRHLARTRPVPGNHDYDDAGVRYYQYFGALAGPVGLGYYSFNLGDWHIVALNSQIPMVAGTKQLRWLEDDLASSKSRCTLAYWHDPLFSSGPAGNTPAIADVWRVLYRYNAEIVLAGDEHLYERFAPQDPDGRADPVGGIRQFIVGTGGAKLYDFPSIKPNSEVRASVHGVLKIVLDPASYSWEFIPIAGTSFRDSGTGVCR